MLRLVPVPCSNVGRSESEPAGSGFEVDLDWKSGQLQAARIRSVGGDTARLRYKGDMIAIKLNRGQELDVTTVGEKIHLSAPNIARASVDNLPSSGR